MIQKAQKKSTYIYRPKKGNYRCDIYLQEGLSYGAEIWGEHFYYRYILATAESS